MSNCRNNCGCEMSKEATNEIIVPISLDEVSNIIDMLDIVIAESEILNAQGDVVEYLEQICKIRDALSKAEVAKN